MPGEGWQPSYATKGRNRLPELFSEKSAYRLILSEFKQLDFDNEESLITWAKETVDASDIPLASVPKGTESVKAFVTCSYGRWNGHERTVVYACEEAGELK